MFRWNVFIIVLLALFCGQVRGQTLLYVTPDGSGEGTISDPAGFQAALDSAGHDPDDAEIRMAQGTYYGNFNCEYDTLLEKDLEILGGWTPDFSSRIVDPANTVPDGQNTGRVFRFVALSKKTPGGFTLEGFTVRNGWSTNGSGGGLQIQTFAPGEIIINRNIIEDNKPEHPDSGFYHGGGMIITNYDYDNKPGGKVTVSNNIVRNNVAGYGPTSGQGGGMFAYCTDTILVDTVGYGLQYYYSISAVDTSGVESAISNSTGLLVSKVLDLGPDIELCEGESVKLDAGGGFLDYQWYN